MNFDTKKIQFRLFIIRIDRNLSFIFWITSYDLFLKKKIRKFHVDCEL